MVRAFYIFKFTKHRCWLRVCYLPSCTFVVKIATQISWNGTFTKYLLCVSGRIDSGATKTCEIFLILAHRRNSFILFYSSIQRGKTTAIQQAGSLMYPTRFPGVSSFQAPNYLTCSKQKSLFMYARGRNL